MIYAIAMFVCTFDNTILGSWLRVSGFNTKGILYKYLPLRPPGKAAIVDTHLHQKRLLPCKCLYKHLKQLYKVDYSSNLLNEHIR